jgi:hypothetical protein
LLYKHQQARVQQTRKLLYKHQPARAQQARRLLYKQQTASQHAVPTGVTLMKTVWLREQATGDSASPPAGLKLVQARALYSKFRLKYSKQMRRLQQRFRW